MIELAKIKINETLELPIRCDLYVLDMLQQEFGSIEEFEKKLLGIREENEQTVVGEPSVNAVAHALPLMIMEGLDIDRELNGRSYEVKSVKHLIAMTTRNYRELAAELHAEMRRCFAKK